MKKTNIDVKLVKRVYCFPHGHGIYTSNLVSKKKIMSQPFFEFWKDFYKSIVSTKWYSHHTHQEPKRQEERDNQ